MPTRAARTLAGKIIAMSDGLADWELSEASKAAFESMQFGAGTGVSLVKGGELLAIVTIHQSTPRKWTKEEIALGRSC